MKPPMKTVSIALLSIHRGDKSPEGLRRTKEFARAVRDIVRDVAIINDGGPRLDKGTYVYRPDIETYHTMITLKDLASRVPDEAQHPIAVHVSATGKFTKTTLMSPLTYAQQAGLIDTYVGRVFEPAAGALVVTDAKVYLNTYLGNRHLPSKPTDRTHLEGGSNAAESARCRSSVLLGSYLALEKLVLRDELPQAVEQYFADLIHRIQNPAERTKINIMLYSQDFLEETRLLMDIHGRLLGDLNYECVPDTVTQRCRRHEFGRLVVGYDTIDLSKMADVHTLTGRLKSPDLTFAPLRRKAVTVKQYASYTSTIQDIYNARGLLHNNATPDWLIMQSKPYRGYDPFLKGRHAKMLSDVRELITRPEGIYLIRQHVLRQFNPAHGSYDPGRDAVISKGLYALEDAYLASASKRGNTYCTKQGIALTLRATHVSEML